MQLRKKVSRDNVPDRPAATGPSAAGSLMLAAMALPGLMAPGGAHAEAAPEKTTIGFKYLDYVDYQADPNGTNNGGKRISTQSPSVFFQVPVKDVATVEGSFVLDSISGASPLYHSTLSGASSVGKITDRRKAGDLKATWFFDRTAIGVGTAFSSENDYDSNAFSVDARFSSADNNTTFAVGAGYAPRDKISSINDPTLHQTRRVADFLVGVTKVLSPNDLVQVNVTYTDGKGYFSDPYKTIDVRPDERKQETFLVRHLHYFEGPGAALHSSYRYYKNDWGIAAHTIEEEWYQPLGHGWLVRPNLRYYTQRAAEFYFDPPFPAGFVPGRLYSADHRLSAFGAVTAGLKVAKEFDHDLSVDLKYEWYQQRASWRLGGDGSPGLENFTAHWLSVGTSKKF